MSSFETTFEVRVRNNGNLGMKHIDASNSKSASIKGRKYGHVVSVRKVDKERQLKYIEQLDLHQPPLIEYVEGSSYTTAIAMDEMIWNKKKKRSERLESRQKDKNHLDK